MKTFFASPEKAEHKELAAAIALASGNPVVSGLLRSVSGLLAVLNEHRQIVALNDELLQTLGIDDPGQALGLRPGEALECIHAHKEPAGCGTTMFCCTCGAAIAIVSSLKENRPLERVCTLTTNKDGKSTDVVLLIRSQPIRVEDKRFVLLVLQDITKQQQRGALERAFFHDINNMLGILSSASELLVRDSPSALAQTVHRTTQRLIREVAIQRYLLQSDTFDYQPMWDDFPAAQIVEELRSFFVKHPAARRKRIDFPPCCPAITVTTDISLLLRVLCNMIINALEAALPDTAVKVWLEHDAETVTFAVWNPQKMAKETADRIFQLNFSTKAEAGRGVGTYSMKLLGEKILGGHITFTTSSAEGTAFRFAMPMQHPD